MTKTRSHTAGKVIVCRIDRCMGCKSCELACALEHSEFKSLQEAVASEAKPQRRVHVEPAGARALPVQCRHCEDAPCVAVCPTGAIHRADESSPVVVDAEKCITCKLCTVVCPFGVIEVSRTGKAVVKCDLCRKRVEAGKQPACVAACPTRALQFVSLKEQSSRRRRQAAAIMADQQTSTDDPPR